MAIPRPTTATAIRSFAPETLSEGAEAAEFFDEVLELLSIAVQRISIAFLIAQQGSNRTQKTPLSIESRVDVSSIPANYFVASAVFSSDFVSSFFSVSVSVS